MASKKKSKLASFNGFIAFILYSVVYALIAIGNVVQWLIKKLIQSLRLIFLSLIYVFRVLTHIGKREKKPAYTLVYPVIKSIQRADRRLTRALIKGLRKVFHFLFRLIPRHWRYFVGGVLTTLLFVFLPYQGYVTLRSLPSPTLLSNRVVPVTTKIFDRDGNLLYEFYVDQNRTPIRLSEVPLIVKQATIAIEDQNFYNHLGVSPRGIFRAAYETLINKNIQGGSTITQQLIKSALLTPIPTIRRKVTEIILAFWAERLYTKDEILEMYLNQVPYGGTAWGIEAAAQTYFGKSVKDLTLGEATLIAGLPAAPTSYSPLGEYPNLAYVRQHEVLSKMVDAGYISQHDADNARQEKIVFAKPNVAIKAPHFVMYVRDVLASRYGLRMVEQGGLRVTTTLDLSTQELVQDIVRSEVEKLGSLLVGNGAAMVVNPKNGEILAMVGSKNYFDDSSGNVNVTNALRQPGSAIKVVTYALALENGFTPATILDDSPVVYVSAGAPPYSPVNYDGRFHGQIPLRFALANSYNVPAVKVLARLGVGAMIDKGRKMGITSWRDSSRYGLSLTLGAGEVKMVDMMSVYSTLANGGKRADITPIIKVTNYRGEELEGKHASPVQTVSPEVAFILSDILSDNRARESAFGPNSSLVIPGKTVSVKTGTSNDKRDNVTYGYTPSYVVGVWVGNNDNRPMHPVLTSGVTGAAPIWQQIMIRLLSGKADEKPLAPPNIVALPCYGRTEYFVKGTQPPGCPRWQPLATPAVSQSPSVRPTPTRVRR